MSELAQATYKLGRRPPIAFSLDAEKQKAAKEVAAKAEAEKRAAESLETFMRQLADQIPLDEFWEKSPLLEKYLEFLKRAVGRGLPVNEEELKEPYTKSVKSKGGYQSTHLPSNLNASGKYEQEAIQNLKQTLQSHLDNLVGPLTDPLQTATTIKNRLENEFDSAYQATLTPQPI